MYIFIYSVNLILIVMVFRLKVEQPQEVVTGNPTVFKMLVSFYRHARGHNALRQILGSAVKDVLSDGALSIRTDPLEIYKTWINQTETKTGTKRSPSLSLSLSLCLPVSLRINQTETRTKRAQ